MNERSGDLTSEQRAIRDKCFHPSGTFEEFPKEEIEQSISDRFEKIVHQYPHRLAVKMGDRAVTYDELNKAANRIAKGILDRRGPQQEPVVVLFDQGIDAIAATLGALKAGKFYVPVNPSFPNTRIAAIVDDAQSSLLITDSKNIAVGRRVTQNVLNIDEIDASVSSENLCLPLSPNDLAYIIYTSGTTGKPKGVFQNQRNLLQRTLSHSNAIHVCAADRMSLIQSHSTGGGRTNIFGALLNGAALFPFDFRTEGLKLARWILDECITIYASGPLVFRQWVDALTDSEEFPELRLIQLWGMPVSTEDVARYQSHFSPDCLLAHVLGTSEAGTNPFYFIDKCSRVTQSPIPVGYSVGDTKVFVVDESGKPAEPEIVGEITFQSRYLACGYWRNTKLTQEKFLPDSEGGDERLYRTGDLGRMSADGCLYHLGRKDLRVKIRGYSVEISEIESVLREHPEIKAVVVVAADDAKGEPRLIAYLVPAIAIELTASALRNYLIPRLPEYMVPSIFVTLPSMPLTPNGKIDRKALPQPLHSRPGQDATYVAPRTALERELKEIWSEVLCIDDIGVLDNFFDLGGHSLRAAQILSRIHKGLNVEIPLEKLFAAPTIAALAECIESARQTSGGAATFPLGPITRDDPLPLSFAQQRLWFLDQLEPGSVRYNVALALLFTGRLDVELLKRCLNEIVKRHESLRTVITVVDGRPCQKVMPAMSIGLPVVDLGELASEETPDTAIERFIVSEAQRPFDLSSAPLIRSGLLSLEPERHVLLLTLHHIAFDGWSGTIVLREIASLYADFLHKQSPRLPDLRIQYSDYAVWQRGTLHGAVLENLLTYWKKQLQNLPRLDLPTDRPRSTAQSCRGARKWFALSPTTTRLLNVLTRQENTTLFMLLLAAFQTLLHRYTAQTDIVTGTPVAGRRRAEIENLVGFFLNMLVLRVDLSGNPTFRQLLARTRLTCLEAYAHEDLPFELLVEELKPQRSSNQNPLFQVSFVLQNFPKAPFESAGIKAAEMDIDPGIARFDLHVFMTEEENGLKGYFEYNTDLFDAATIERMVGHFQTLLDGIVVNPDLRISELPILGQVERNRLLIEWNDTGKAWAKEKCLHQLFEEQVQRTPNAIAASLEDQELTYEELNGCANLVAQRLQGLGVGPENLVGLCVERSLELIIGILGILKAGGAYVPLDPSYPRDRLDFMLKDSAVTVLLTQKHLSTQLPACDAPLICLDLEDLKNSLDDAANDVNLDNNAKPNDLAYVIYTSGSTGKPKGVLITHANVMRLFEATKAWFHFNSADVWMLFHSYAFDFSVWEMWGALLNGGKLLIVPHSVSRSPEEFAAFVKENHVTVLNQTPSAFRQLMPYLISTLAPEQSALRYIIFGGEALDPQSLQPWFDRYGDDPTRLINMYGITETTVHVTYRPITRADTQSGVGSLIGKPIPDLSIYVLDPHQQLQPIGIPGEIYVGGAGVAKGYLNRPELTAERFIPNPFSSEPGARLYRSGDLARWLPTKELEYLGRIDDQVKIRGYRIEPGEIERVLQTHAAVRQCAVAVRADSPGDKRIVGYVVMQPECPTKVEDLKKFLKQKLPDYMIPSAWVQLDQLPLLPNGKVDRGKLPVPDQNRSESEKIYEAPRSPVEVALANVWCEVLKIDKVSIRDNFFDLGGHSLLATQIVSRVRSRLSAELPLRALFESPTVAALAAVIDKIQAKSSDAPAFAQTLREVGAMTEEEARNLLGT